MSKRYSREGWHPQGDDHTPKLQRGAIMLNASGLATMCKAEHAAKVEAAKKADADGIALTDAQKELTKGEE